MKLYPQRAWPGGAVLRACVLAAHLSCRVSVKYVFNEMEGMNIMCAKEWASF